MRVIATAGHVDHGKSTLVRALTGMEPDRWAEERKRGMTIDLGYAWTQLDTGDMLAFVDVPGHQRFIANMLAGLGPAPAVLLVIAADEGWRRQTSEHLDAIDALGIEHGVLAVTRSDLAEPARVIADAQARLGQTTLAGVPAVAVSGRTGHGMAELRRTLADVVGALPPARGDGPVRLWIDRVFTVRGSGTVVTGTLGAGRIEQGQALQLNGRQVQVRGLEQLGVAAGAVEGTARVAVNLRGIDREQIHRGDCLLSPGDWRWTDAVDVRLRPVHAELGGEVMVHIGSAAVAARVRDLPGECARLLLRRPLPLRIGDKAVIRDPGQQVVAAGALVVDPDPPALARRGAAARRAAALVSGRAATAADQVGRRGAVRRQDLQMLGVALDDSANGLPEDAPPGNVLSRGDWLISPEQWKRWKHDLLRIVDEHAERDPQRPAIPVESARRKLNVAEPALLTALATEAGLRAADGRISRAGTRSVMGTAEMGIVALEQRWRTDPLASPDRNELAQLRLRPRDLATAAATGRLIQLAADVVVSPDALSLATEWLAELAGPFTASDARQRLGVTRRVAIPLLEKMDSLGITERVDASRRIIHLG